jgi:hypothetical protein
MLGYDVRLWELLTVTSPVGQLFDVQVLLSKFGEQRFTFVLIARQ